MLTRVVLRGNIKIRKQKTTKQTTKSCQLFKEEMSNAKNE